MPACASSANQPRKGESLPSSAPRKLLWPIVIFLAIVAVDQATKIWAVSALTGHPAVRVIGEFFMLSLIYNAGGAMGTSLGSSTYYLVISLVLLPFIGYYIYRYRDLAAVSWPLALVAAGAVGNVIDRLRLDGRVVDFLDFDFFDVNFLGITRWWTFNIADAAITVGIISLLIVAIFFGHESADNHQAQEP